MKDIFISHVEEDADLALEIALALEEAGFFTWCYELDSVPGPSYLTQTRAAIDQAKALVLVISQRAIDSQQVSREVVRAFEAGKRFIPVLRGISHEQFQNSEAEWRDVLGSASSIQVTSRGFGPVLPRILDGLRALHVPAARAPSPERCEDIRRLLGSFESRPPGHETISSPVRKWVPDAKPPPSRRPRRLRLTLALSAMVIGSVAALAIVGQRISLPHVSTSRSAATNAPRIARADGPLVMGVMDIRAREPVPDWMRDFTRDGLNTVLSKAPSVRVYSKQKIDFVREKRGLSEIEAAEQLGIAKMISGTLTTRDGKIVLEIQVVDIESGLLEDSERVEGHENELVELQNRAAVKLVRALNVVLNAEDVNRMFVRTNDSLDSYKMLTDTLGFGEEEEKKPSQPKPIRNSRTWWRFTAIAYAEEISAEEAAVRQLLENYRAALEAKDLDRLASVQEMGEGQREALVRYFENADSLKVQFTNLDILVEGDEALATFTRDDIFKDVHSGREIHLEHRINGIIAKQNGSWIIRGFKKPS